MKIIYLFTSLVSGMYSILQPDQTGEETRKGIALLHKKKQKFIAQKIINLSLCLIKNNMWGSGVTAPRFPTLRTRWRKEATFISQNSYVILGNGNDTPIPISRKFRWARSRSGGFGGGGGEERKISNRDVLLLMV
jgi:hypothetical protein